MKSSSRVAFDQELIRVFTHISRALGFRMSILDRGFAEVAPLAHQPHCGYCRMIQQELGLLERCRENDRAHCLQAKQEKRIIRYTCHAGLKESVYPFFAHGECIGYFLVGQFRTAGEDPGKVLLAADPHLRTPLLREYRSLPVYDEEKLESALEIIRFLTESMVERRMVAPRETEIADAVRSLITEDFSVSIPVEEAAYRVNRSVSSLNQSLKAVTGKSFKQLSLSMKMEEAGRILRERRELTVAEAGALVGVEDPFYFSRIFKKYEGVSPRGYRQELSYH